MMKIQSDDYLQRQLKTALVEALADTPVVCILGPRQCGKSTLAKRHDPKRPYLTLDDQNYLNLAMEDPQGFVDQLPEQITIDEIQRAPELTLAIKRNVDANRQPGRFLLTGSANLLQLPRLADSLAGRMECLYLQPFTASEIEGCKTNFLETWLENGITVELAPDNPPAPTNLPERLVAGGYPEAVRRSPARARTWQNQYLLSLIERDIHDIASVKDGANVTRLLEYASLNTAQLLNLSSLSKALSFSRATVESYLSILERLFLIQRLPAWHSNRSKRLIKTPKVHLCDSGLASTLSQLRANQWNEARPRFGHLLESYILQQLTAMAGWMQEPPSIYHYRDKDQLEVDIVIESKNKIWGIEVKAAATAGPSDGKGLLRLAEIAGVTFQQGIVFYDGSSTIPLNKRRNIYAVPISKLWNSGKL
jgi:predicted AAA+ superfamily ATPase